MERTLSSGPANTRQPSVEYVCLIRFPFPRGDFVDPDPVSWNVTKDRQLWKIVSKATSSRDLDWADLSERFQVPLQFLLQQAAWLYERHFAQMKAQLKKLGTTGQVGQSGTAPGSNVESLGSSHLATGAQGTSQRPGSQGPRTTSALSTHQKDSPSWSTSSLRRPSSRTSVNPRSPPSKSESTGRRTTSASRGPTSRASKDSLGSSHTMEASSARTALPELSSENLSSTDDITNERIDGKPQDTGKDRRAEDDDDDSSDTSLPFASRPDRTETISTNQTRLSKPDAAHERTRGGIEGTRDRSPEIRADDRGSSGKQAGAGNTTPSGIPNPDSKRQSRLSSRPRRDGSDGTPSMGSSYSDLDGDSLTQSALEDALLSNMRQGGMASRMSTISQALRSKYL